MMSQKAQQSITARSIEGGTMHRLPDYNLDPPEDPPECFECGARLSGQQFSECKTCGWQPDEPDWSMLLEDVQE
jgi:hypothetical protein